MPADAIKVQGYDFSDGADYAKILGAMRYSGFQATSFGMAVDEINRMIQWRYSDEPILPEDDMQGKPDCLGHAIRPYAFKSVLVCAVWHAASVE
jgi:deoxyhypusine synthase